MEESKVIKIGIGFATGRKSFKKVLKTYVFNWKESGIAGTDNISMNLFVAYDLKYYNTKPTDYTSITKDISDVFDETYFIGNNQIQNEVEYLINANIIDENEAKMFFGSGYAAKRNAVLYMAMKQGIDYLLFLDDDEYPMAVTHTRPTAVWSGQHVLLTHLQYIKDADITNGHHCGYISPIPYIEFNETMQESDFRMFIEAISNDIINWDNIKRVMNNGGVTYADTNILVSNCAIEVEEVNHTKFISGANLCLNLTNPSKVYPFYNPPNARGEDTFLSTCLTNHKVLRVPCYAFHDGFSTYNHLMDGVLPISLKYIKADSEKIISRFYHACIGWIRYKPLLLYITQRDQYDIKIKEMRQKLDFTLPKICAYFGDEDFMNVSKELEKYNKNVKKHYAQFIHTQDIWKRINEFINK